MKYGYFAVAAFLPFTLLADPTVSLAGMQVVYDDGAKEFDGFKTYNMDVGYGVMLLIRSSDKSLIRFDDEEAELTIGGAKAECQFFSGMGFSDDRKALKIEFKTDGDVKPSSDGTLEVKGTLPVAVATGKEEIKSEPFALKKGEAVKLPKGMPKMTIKSLGKPDFGDDPLQIEFSTDQKMDDFAGVRFTTKDGKEVESDRRGSMWMGLGKKGSGTVEYSFSKKHDDLIMVLESWTGLEEKSLEVDLKAGQMAK